MNCRSGFSLVELSIVLVILGLLTGGILAGQSLIRAAEIRSVSADIFRYMAAIHTFREKYLGLPGDLTNATRFWGAADGSTGNTVACKTATAAGTCNGNGDGYIMLLNDTTTTEAFRAWQQMAAAGLVEGAFTGIANAGGTEMAVPGENVPNGRIAQSGYTILARTVALTAENGSWWKTSAGNLISIGKMTSAGSETRSPFLKPEEAWNVDTKLDDGKPSYGFIHGTRPQSAPSATSECATTQVTETAAYNLTNSSIDCALRAFIR